MGYTPPRKLAFEEWAGLSDMPSVDLSEADDCVIDGAIKNTCTGVENGNYEQAVEHFTDYTGSAQDPYRA